MEHGYKPKHLQTEPRRQPAGGHPRKAGIAWLLSGVLTVLLLAVLFLGQGIKPAAVRNAGLGLMEKYDMRMANSFSDTLGDVLAIEKVYWLSDDDVVAPEPNPEAYGTATDPSELGWFLEAAAPLLDGEETLFNTDVQTIEGSSIKYYLDDSIMAITWKEGFNVSALTFSEVKVAHPSQFRRFLAGGEYGSSLRYKPTEMAASVNAVTASNGDYYSYRKMGIVVNNGVVHRSESEKLDTCFIDKNGDLLFVPMGTFHSVEEIQQYVAENDVRFSLAFGPILLQDGENMVPESYPIGEIDKNHSRAALCQLGPCHYVVVTANIELNYYLPPKLKTFGRFLHERGIDKAYTIDGGQTASIVMGDELMNSVDYGGERNMSDIIYFATAIPDGG